ncbi:MAG: Txe/YoeB family addiction module toxin [Chryseotalea sp.]
MIVAFTENAWADYLYWQQHDKVIVERINLLIKEIKKEPFKGIGKPEPLRGNLSGYWSRRIDIVHRIVYHIEGVKNKQVLAIIQVRFHY